MDGVHVDVMDIEICNDSADDDTPKANQQKGQIQCPSCDGRFTSQYELKVCIIHYKQPYI